MYYIVMVVIFIDCLGTESNILNWAKQSFAMHMKYMVKVKSEQTTQTEFSGFNNYAGIFPTNPLGLYP